MNLFGFAEPSRRDLSSFLMISGSLAGPGDDPIGAHEDCARAQPILGDPCHIGDSTAPAARKRLKRRTSVKVQKQASPRPEVLAESRPVDQLEVGSAAAHEWMAAAEIVTNRDAPHALGEVGRAVARVDEITDYGFERARTPARSQ